jgi:hypothetical protein
MALTVKPAFGANVSSKDWERFFGKWFPNGVFEGLQVTAGSGLNVNISAGTGHINGYFIESDATETRSVNASSTNRVWCRLTRDASNFVTGWNFHITTTATPPSDSFLLAEVVTSGSAVTSVTDTRNSGMAGTILDATPSTSNTKPHLRVRDTTTASPYLEFVKSDGSVHRLSFSLISTTTFTSSGTYNTPSSAKLLFVIMCGGGGGGGGASGGFSTSGSAGGCGGGSGGYMEFLIFEPSSSYAVTIGSGGSGGAGAGTSGGTNGSSGGSTSFGPYSVSGGGGGLFSSTNGAGAGATVQLLGMISGVKNGVNGGNGGNSGGAGQSGQSNVNHRTATSYNGGSGGSGGGHTNFGGGGGGGGGGYFGNGGNGGNGATSTTSASSGGTGAANSGAGGGGGGGGNKSGQGYEFGANGGSGGAGRVVVYAYG